MDGRLHRDRECVAQTSSQGGPDIDPIAGTSIPTYVYLENGWRIRPDEASHTLTVTGGVILVQGGGDPFADTVGLFRVNVRYQQPVQAIGVSTGAVVAPSQQEIRDAMKLAPSVGAPSVDSIDDQLDDIAASVLTQQEVRDAMLLSPGGAAAPNSVDDQLADLAAAISAGTLTMAQADQLLEIWKRLSLDSADPFTATPSQMRTASGDIIIDLTGDGVASSTGTRQP